MPTAADLAQSFLEQQPSAEKKELEAALAAESQDLGASLALSDYESDEDPVYGTGQTLSLPTFLTGFLHGIVDRTEVRIKSVTFQLDIEVPVEPGAPAPELVTFQLALDGVDVEGVTAPSLAEDGTPKIVPRDGKRHIALGSLRAFLITEANVFSTLARSPSMPSSLASQSPVSASRSVSRETTSLSQSLHREPSADSPDLSASQYQLQDSEEALNIPYDLEGSGDENDDDPEPPASSLSTPRASVYQDLGPSIRSQSRSAHAQIDEAPWSPAERGARPEPALGDAAEIGRHPPEPLEDSFHSSSESDSSEIALPEDLGRSHVFSHEEAESMYMSAFSQIESVRLRSGMPGGWESSPPTSPPGDRNAGPGAVAGPPEHEEQQPAAPENLTVPEQQTEEPSVPQSSTSEPSDDNGGEDAEAIEHDEATETAESEAPDDVATPRGPTRIVKEILSLKSITVYIPSNHEQIRIQQTAPPSGAALPTVPGAFSVHVSTAASGQRRVYRHGAATEHPEQPEDKSIDIVLAPLDVRFDASVGFLLAMVVSELLNALRGKQTATAAAGVSGASPQSTKETALPEIKVTSEKISLLFLDKLAGVADTAERIFSTPQAISATMFSSKPFWRI